MRNFADGGYTGDDPIVKYRMGMIDAQGNDLTGPKESTIEDESGRGNISPNAAEFNKDIPGAGSRAIEKTVVKTKVVPIKKPIGDDTINEDVKQKKPYINIPDKSSVGLRQFKSDATSPMGRLFKKITGMKSGGSVSSASKRADGIAIKGKTRGRIV